MSISINIIVLSKMKGCQTVSIVSYICIGFSLFTEVMLYNVTSNAELVNIKLLLLGLGLEIQD